MRHSRLTIKLSDRTSLEILVMLQAHLLKVTVGNLEEV
jgi:hypothetical protein